MKEISIKNLIKNLKIEMNIEKEKVQCQEKEKKVKLKLEEAAVEKEWQLRLERERLAVKESNRRKDENHKKFQSFVPEWKIRLNKRKKDKKDKKDKKESKESKDKEELQELKMKEINSFVVENAGLPDYNEAEEEEEEEEEEEIKAVSDPVAVAATLYARGEMNEIEFANALQLNGMHLL